MIQPYQSQQMAWSNNGIRLLDKYPERCLPILSVSSPFPFLRLAKKCCSIALKVSPDCGIYRVGMLWGRMKVTRGVVLTQLNLVSSTLLFFVHSSNWLVHAFGPPIAWSVSLNPKGGTYASTSGSGNVTIHSAEVGNFGERLTTLPSGRNKFGMRCKHVRPIHHFGPWVHKHAIWLLHPTYFLPVLDSDFL